MSIGCTAASTGLAGSALCHWRYRHVYPCSTSFSIIPTPGRGVRQKSSPRPRLFSSHPLPEGAAIAGEGEITPIRYLQRVDGVRPDLWVIHSNEPGIRDALLPRALADDVPLYALRGTEAGLRLSPLMPTTTRQSSHLLTSVWARSCVRAATISRTCRCLAPRRPSRCIGRQRRRSTGAWKILIDLLDETGAGAAESTRSRWSNIIHPRPATRALAVDQYESLLPSDLSPGRYQLVFGWYNGSDRLVWKDGRDTQLLGHIEVAP